MSSRIRSNARVRRLTAKVRPLDPSDPRSLKHPSHRDAWLQLAEVIGRLEAREMIRLSKQGKTDEDRGE
jgi:hypothetical protein